MVRHLSVGGVEREWGRGGNQPAEASPSNKIYRKSQEVLLKAQNTAGEEQVDE